MLIPQDGKQLMTVMRRPDFGGPLRFVASAQKGWESSLSLAPGDMKKAVAALAALLSALPRGALSAKRKAQLRRKLYAGLRNVLRGYAEQLVDLPALKTDPQAMEEMANKIAEYTNLRE